MNKIFKYRMTGHLDGDFVVFMIGMRVNKWWKFWKWGPVAAAMPKMLIELAGNPELGLLHARTFFGFPNIFVVQYWRSFEHLHAYAANPARAHLPAWRAFNRAVASGGDVGIWHETYLVGDGAHESVYNNMPRWGLAAAGAHAPADGMFKSAKSWLGRAAKPAIKNPDLPA